MRIPKTTPPGTALPHLAQLALIASALGIATAACSTTGSDNDGSGEALTATPSDQLSNDPPATSQDSSSEPQPSSPASSTPSAGDSATSIAPNSTGSAPGPVNSPGPQASEPIGAGGEGPSAGGAVGMDMPGSVDAGATEPVANNTGGAPASGGAPAGDAGSDITAGGSAGTAGQSGAAGAPSTADPFGPDVDGTCTESQRVDTNASGSGPHEVVVEVNSSPGIDEGTIFRPADLGDGMPYPIFVWGEGGCSQDGLSNAAAMAEIASHGYFVIADGTPNGSGSRTMDSNNVPSMGEPLLAYVDWALNENAKPCSAYYHSVDMTKVAANGFSCGGLMSTGTAGDPRITTWGSTSSGTFSENQAFYESVHSPVLIIEGGPSDIAFENGARDYENISELGHPIMWFSKDIGHGGDLFSQGGGDFTRINLAWLNWWLKGDETATGKGVLVGDGCSYCSDSEWEVKSANLP